MQSSSSSSISSFMEKNFKHFNARETLAAAKGWHEFSKNGGKMILALAGAMSTAEIGITLAKMIRAGKIHAISSTAANIEEDIFNLISNKEYKMVPNYRSLKPKDEVALRDAGLNRVTDVCIPEPVMDVVTDKLLKYWQEADEKGESHFHFEYMYRLIADGFLDGKEQVPRENSWVIAAYEMGIPIYTPGFEDSTVGNMFTAHVMKGNVKRHDVVKPGTMQFEHLVRWYQEESYKQPMGFFQIGGGIAGDFSICAVPCIRQDLEEECPLLTYFAQISDSTTSYGSYSGAPPNEKITWWKLAEDCESYMINSDASIVAPLVFQYVLDKHIEEVAESVKVGATKAEQVVAS